MISIFPWLIPFGVSEYVKWEFMQDGGRGNAMGVAIVTWYAFLSASIIAVILSLIFLKKLKLSKNNKAESINSSITLLIPLSLNIFIAFQCIFFANHNIQYIAFGAILLIPTTYVLQRFIRSIFTVYYA